MKIQVEFNPANVAAYRLIGYENRMLRNQDFNDDKKDAGEIGAGHTVTALYEIVPAGVDDRRADGRSAEVSAPCSNHDISGVGRDELMTVKLRYKAPDGDESRLITVPVKNQARPSCRKRGIRRGGRRVRHGAAPVGASRLGDAIAMRPHSRGDSAARIPMAIARSSSGWWNWPQSLRQQTQTSEKVEAERDSRFAVRGFAVTSSNCESRELRTANCDTANCDKNHFSIANPNAYNVPSAPGT